MFVPSTFDTKIVFILNTLLDDDGLANKDVVNVVPSAAAVVLALV